MKICSVCGQIEGIKEYDNALWDIYYRLRDARSTLEPLVFTGDWMEENVHDDEDFDAIMLAMGKDMQNRGLCTECARPDLYNVSPDDIMDIEEAEEIQEMWAEEAQERRFGC